MTDGGDNFSGQGNAATAGAAFPTALTVYGGAARTRSRAARVPTPETDHIGNDVENLKGGAGAGDDVIDGQAGADILLDTTVASSVGCEL